MTEDRKSFEHALFAAFLAGVNTGAGYESAEAIPVGYRNLRWRAWRDFWGGEMWSVERWNQEMEEWHKQTPRGWNMANPEDLIGKELTITVSDPEPQPGDGPQYHDDHASWRERNSRRQSLGEQMGHPGGHYG